MTDLINRDEAGKLLGYSPTHARRWLKDKGIKEILIGKSVRFQREDVVRMAAVKGQWEPGLIGAAEAAAMLTVSKQTVYHLIRCGALAGKRVGRSWLIAKTDIENYINRGGVGSISTQTSFLDDPEQGEAIPQDQPETTKGVKPWDVEVDTRKKEYRSKQMWEVALLMASDYVFLGIEFDQGGTYRFVLERADGIEDLLLRHQYGELTVNSKSLIDNYQLLKKKLKAATTPE